MRLFSRTVKARTFDEFLQIMTAEGCDQLAACMDRRPARFVDWLFGPAGSIGISTWVDYIELASPIGKGRVVVYRESFPARFYSLRGLADFEERQMLALRLALTAWDRMDKVREALPHVVCLFIGGDQRTMSEDIKRRMYADAAKNSITPFTMAS